MIGGRPILGSKERAVLIVGGIVILTIGIFARVLWGQAVGWAWILGASAGLMLAVVLLVVSLMEESGR